jgi:hypothetical protein
MFISPAWKDWLNTALAVLGIVGLPFGIWRWSVATKVERTATKAAGIKAMQQIHDMSTNHFPHMEADLKKQTELIEKSLEKHEKANELLTDIAGNIKVLVDRGIRL